MFARFFSCSGKSFIIFAGIPPTKADSGTSVVTTAFAPITALLPMDNGPSTFAPGPMNTWLPSLGIVQDGVPFRVLPEFPPKVTPCWIYAYSPI